LHETRRTLGAFVTTITGQRHQGCLAPVPDLNKSGLGVRKMDRRKLLRGAISAGLMRAVPGWLGTASAQQPNLPVIGLLDAVWGHLIGNVGAGLRENGFQGRAFTIEYGHWTGTRPDYQADRMAKYAADLVKRKAALILAFSTRTALAAKSVTGDTPIVFLADEPVAAGLVDSLNRPGGNLTGAACPVSGSIAKRIEIICELIPSTNSIVLVSDPANPPAHDIEIREAQAAATARGLQLSIVAWTGEHEFEIELAALPRNPKAALVFGNGLPFFAHGVQLDYLASRYEFPAILGSRDAVEQGALVSYGTRFADGGHLMGVYAARILKGDKPADLPVQQITTTELVINRWVAKSRGIRICPTLLARADEVID
jgi:putative ABC transport system substrate-binding protein